MMLLMADLTPYLKSLSQWELVDPFLERDLLAAVAEGAPPKQVAREAGLLWSEYLMIRKWGEAGREPWCSLVRKMERAKGEAERPKHQNIHTKGCSSDATMAQSRDALKHQNPEEYVEDATGAPGGGPQIVLNLVKNFEPVNPSPDVIDGELVEG